MLLDRAPEMFVLHLPVLEAIIGNRIRSPGLLTSSGGGETLGPGADHRHPRESLPLLMTSLGSETARASPKELRSVAGGGHSCLPTILQALLFLAPRGDGFGACGKELAVHGWVASKDLFPINGCLNGGGRHKVKD